MGFSTIIAGVSIATLILLAISYFVMEIPTSYNVLDEVLTKKMELLEVQSKTMIKILNNETNSTSPYLLISNDGYVTLKTGCLSFYMNGTYVNRTNYNVTILNDTINQGLWDPNEVLNLSLLLTITPGDYKFTISTCEGVKYSRLVRVI